MLSGVGRGGKASLTQVHPMARGLRAVQVSMGAEQQVPCIAASENFLQLSRT